LDYKDFDLLATSIMAALAKPYFLIESLDFVCYEQGHYINAHHDFLYNPRKFYYYKKGGIRQSMALLLLNEDFEGGETYFPHLDVTIPPKKGRLAYWQQDYDFQTNWSTIHEGKEVITGKKYGVIMCISNLPRIETKGY
jgi:prolyl 4-hydroxylase